MKTSTNKLQAEKLLAHMLSIMGSGWAGNVLQHYDPGYEDGPEYSAQLKRGDWIIGSSCFERYICYTPGKNDFPEFFAEGKSPLEAYNNSKLLVSEEIMRLITLESG